MDEIWKPIIHSDGRYEISNSGRIKRLPKYNRKGVATFVEKIFDLKPSKDGYIRFTIKGRTAQIHRLVALHFIPNPNNYRDVNHLDNNRANNSVENLEWCTHKQNIQHAVKQSRHQHGERHAKAKLTEKDVLYIRESGITGYKISKIYGISFRAAYDIINRKNWRHI